MGTFDQIASDEAINATITALKQNGITAMVVGSKEEAKQKVLEMIPKGAEVMTMTSVTLDEIGVLSELNESGNYISVRSKLNTMNRETQSGEMQKLGAAPEWTVGSVHAVTEDGKVLVASNTGSQLPAYTYASAHVIWVVGVQKLVKNVDEGMKRLNEYVLPLESERAKKAYGMPGSFISKLVIFNREVNPSRIAMVIVKEKLGF